MGIALPLQLVKGGGGGGLIYVVYHYSRANSYFELAVRPSGPTCGPTFPVFLRSQTLGAGNGRI